MKFFLVFYDDDGSREACSTLYSWLVKANTGEEAIQKYLDHSKYDEDPDRFMAQEMDLIE